MVRSGSRLTSGAAGRRSRKAAYSTSPYCSIVCLSISASELDADVAGFGVELQGVHATFAADARLLGATERRAQVAQEPAVDPGDAHVDAPGHAVGTGQIGGPDGGGQAVIIGVGQLHHFVFAVEGGDMAARPEDLLAD